MADEGSRARKMVKDADAKANAFAWFGSTTNKEEAVDIYNKAAAQFKISKEWEEAARCYLKAAEVSAKLKNDLDATNYYMEAGRVYKNISAKDAIANLKIAVTKHAENNRFSMAAKLYKEIAELEEKNNDIPHSLESYQHAADCFLLEDAKAAANQCLLKVADHSALREDYKKAIAVYERVSATSLEQKLLSYSVKDYMFKALICHFVMDANQGEVTSTSMALEKYKEMNPSFEGSRECKLIENCLSAYKNGDVDQFTDHLFNHDRIYKLDNWSSELFLLIKKRMQNPKPGAPATGTTPAQTVDLQGTSTTASSSAAASTTTAPAAASAEPDIS